MSCGRVIATYANAMGATRAVVLPTALIASYAPSAARRTVLFSTTSAVPTPDGRGYYIIDGAGQVFAYGDATWLGGIPAGSADGLDPATTIFASADGSGYWITTALGKVYAFGDAPNQGDESGTHLNGAIIAATGW